MLPLPIADIILIPMAAARQTCVTPKQVWRQQFRYGNLAGFQCESFSCGHAFRRPRFRLHDFMATPQRGPRFLQSWLLSVALLLAAGGGLAFFLLPDNEGEHGAGDEHSGPGDTPGSGKGSADEEWQSEQLADAADLQLKKIASLLDSGEEVEPEAVQPLVTESVWGSPLRPLKFEERFQTRSLTVRRGVELASVSGYRGASRLATALNKMSEPLAAADRIHSKFKIISVDFELSTDSVVDSVVTTEVIFQRAGTLDGGSFQQDATWECIWKIDAASVDNAGSPQNLLLQKLTLLDYEEALQKGSGGHTFSDCTESVFRNEPSFRQQILPGVDYWRSLIQKQYGVFPFGHHGVAVGDVNGDGLDDLYAGQPAGLPNRLYVQNADGTVTDVAAEAGVDLLNRTRGVLLIDVDDDGDQDIVAVLEQVILFMANDGQAHFTESAAVPTTEPGALSAVDYDLDGDLDIYVVNYGDRILSSPDVYHDSNNGGANVLLRNDGDWKFTDVTIGSGLDQNNHRWSFAASWEDYDDDGDPDLYVSNDFGRNNFYRNDGGQFADIAPQAGVEDIAAGMSASWADFDHDGRMDLYVGNMFSSAGLRITGQSRFQKRATSTVRSEFRRHARGNTLFRNVGEDRFEDVSVAAGVTIGRWAWASKFVDINNDGWEDLVVANGFVTGHQTKDL